MLYVCFSLVISFNHFSFHNFCLFSPLIGLLIFYYYCFFFYSKLSKLYKLTRTKCTFSLICFTPSNKRYTCYTRTSLKMKSTWVKDSCVFLKTSSQHFQCLYSELKIDTSSVSNLIIEYLKSQETFVHRTYSPVLSSLVHVQRNLLQNTFVIFHFYL